MIRLDEIPTAFEPPADARPSEIVERIRSIRPSRRAVLRGLVIGAAAAALVPLDWYLARRDAAAQESSADDKSEHMTCMPESYAEAGNNWPASGPAVCYGGYRRGSYPCSGGYHREGRYTGSGESYDSTRLTTNCHGKNAWRWKGYRCSDAITLITFADGTDYNGVTIAACDVGGAEEAPAESALAPSEAAPAPARPPAPAEDPPPSEPSRRGGGSAGDDGGSGDDGRDPSRPRRSVPDLGLGLRSLPGIGSLTGG